MNQSLTTSLSERVALRLRQEGGRMTEQRRLVLNILETMPGHPTAEEIHASASREDSTLNLSTVYRTLRWLEESGFVSTCWFEDDHRVERFDAAPSLPAGHHHFVCRACGEVIEFTDPLLDQVRSNFEGSSGSRIEEAQLTLYGLCASCRGNP